MLLFHNGIIHTIDAQHPAAEALLGIERDELLQLHLSEIVVGGLATDYCVKSSVLDALKHGFRVKAIENAMRAVDLQPGDGDRAIDEMRDAGAEVI